MSKARDIQQTSTSKPTLEGAGVHLKRAFGFGQASFFDPFLMLDDFRSDNPDDYLKGFPWHPHRGIETITYVLAGDVEHRDSLGNKGVISSGDAQWMTAGSGIIHQEMPLGDQEGRMEGFQLWVNLPASDKMMDPRYQNVMAAEIPVAALPGGGEARVICGEADGVRGPVRDIVTDPRYLDISVPANSRLEHHVEPGHTVFAYVISGKGYFDEGKSALMGNESLVLFGDGDEVGITAEDEPVRFLLLSGMPLREPVVWHGPIVMNTDEELQTAFKEYDMDEFVKHKKE